MIWLSGITVVVCTVLSGIIGQKSARAAASPSKVIGHGNGGQSEYLYNNGDDVMLQAN